jgi:hypothetical protein
VKPHAVIATPVAVGQDMVEGHASPLAHTSQESSGCRCEGSRLERLPRVAIAHVTGPGDQARLEDPRPNRTISRCSQGGSSRRAPTRHPPPRAEATRSCRPGAECERDAHVDGPPFGYWTAQRHHDSCTIACPGGLVVRLARTRSQRADLENLTPIAMAAQLTAYPGRPLTSESRQLIQERPPRLTPIGDRHRSDDAAALGDRNRTCDVQPYGGLTNCHFLSEFVTSGHALGPGFSRFVIPSHAIWAAP